MLKLIAMKIRVSHKSAKIHLIYIGTVQACLSFHMFFSVSVGLFPRLSTRAGPKSRSKCFILAADTLIMCLIANYFLLQISN